MGTKNWKITRHGNLKVHSKKGVSKKNILYTVNCMNCRRYTNV